MGIERVKVDMFKTADGKLFPSRHEAEDYEAKTAVTAFVEKYGCSGMDKDMIVDMLLEHADDLRRALDGKAEEEQPA